MRCAIYARVSTNDGRQDCDNQLLRLREYAVSQGWSIVREYVDHASAKGTNGRHEFLQMLADAKAKQFDALLFWSLDRLSREGVWKTLTYLMELDGCGVCFKSFTEQYLDSCGIFKNAIIGILATLAQQERIRISERTKAGLSRKRGFNLWDHEKEIKAMRGKMSIREAAEKLKAKYSLTVDPRMTVHRIWNS